MSEAYFFGYGSLVNRNTHGYAPCHTARATGWRRTWARMADRPLAILTVVPDPDSEIDGLIALHIHDAQGLALGDMVQPWCAGGHDLVMHDAAGKAGGGRICGHVSALSQRR